LVQTSIFFSNLYQVPQDNLHRSCAGFTFCLSEENSAGWTALAEDALFLESAERNKMGNFGFKFLCNHPGRGKALFFVPNLIASI
jgi:hypothetical protein